MGCISSKTDINDLHHNIFQVMNVDDLGNRLNPGQLEITETDLVLYQRRKAPVKWPLRCLRRYGFDAELFSFESGRRCPTGPGIYAFRCQRAEQLFNLLQTHIQVRNNSGGDDAVSREFPIPSAPGPAVPLRGGASGDANYLDPVPARQGSRGNVPTSLRFIAQNGSGPTRLGSVGSSSNGPMSPQGTASPSPPPVPLPNPLSPPSVGNNPNMYYANEELFAGVEGLSAIEPNDNNNKKPLRQPFPVGVVGTVTAPLPADVVVVGKPLARLSVSSGEGVAPLVLNEATEALPMASYINVDLNHAPLSPTYSLDGDSNYARLELSSDAQQGPLYMNVIPGPENGIVAVPELPVVSARNKPALPSYGPSLPLQQEWEMEESRHCYANLEPGEIEVARSHLPKRLSGPDRLLPLSLSSAMPPSQCQQIAMTPPPNQVRQVTYIMLDLDQSKSDLVGVNSPSQQQQPTSPVGAVVSSTLPLPPESPHRASEGYATIDFNKTVALSHSVNPNMDNDSEGSRKTRHNSTINDLITPSTRHSSSE